MTVTDVHSRTTTLGQLLADVGDDRDLVEGAWRDIQISGMSLDTRALSAGELYLALPGRSTHGIHHASAALAAGAVAILTVPGAKDLMGALAEQIRIPIVEWSGLEANLTQLADTFFDYPAKHLRIVAVTGTDGKTSVCRFVASAFASVGQPAGYIGTLGWGMVSAAPTLASTSLTTPDVVALRSMLRDLLDAGASVVALEASSHGIAEGRLDGLSIDVAVLTNLGRDHLDYHGSEEAYAESKARLFDWPSLSAVVVNADDRLGQKLVARHAANGAKPRRLATFSMQTPCSDPGVLATADLHVWSERLQTLPSGLRFVLGEGRDKVDIESPLLGRFNVSNLLACHAVLRVSGVSLSQSAAAVQQLHPVAGRMDRVDARDGRSPVVIVDYAHTPNALAAALHAARDHCSGRLVVVFGCGGDRDTGKRAPMARAALVADRIIVTDDNPRSESSAAIIEDILAGFEDVNIAEVIPDRSDAIVHAVASSECADVIVVAGKGHEDYQIVGAERRAFSDHQVAKAALARRADAAACDPRVEA